MLVEILDPFKCKEKTLPIVPLFSENYQGETSVTLRNEYPISSLNIINLSVFGVPIRPDILHRCIVWQVFSLDQQRHSSSKPRREPATTRPKPSAKFRIGLSYRSDFLVEVTEKFFNKKAVAMHVLVNHGTSPFLRSQTPSRSNVRRHGYKAMGPKLRSYDYTLPYRGIYIYIERESNIDIVRALGLRTALTTKWAQQQLTIIPDCHLDVFFSLRGLS